MSAARPKVADYPFTTLHPHLGVVRLNPNQSFVIADIPGLIEGAAAGAGLGIRFLKHLTRTRLLLHIVDLAPTDPDADPIRDCLTVVRELEQYDPELARKPRWLIFNKLDLIPVEEHEKRIADFLHAVGTPSSECFRICAISGQGCRELTQKLQQALDQLPVAPAAAEASDSTPAEGFADDVFADHQGL